MATSLKERHERQMVLERALFDRLKVDELGKIDTTTYCHGGGICPCIKEPKFVMKHDQAGGLVEEFFCEQCVKLYEYDLTTGKKLENIEVIAITNDSPDDTEHWISVFGDGPVESLSRKDAVIALFPGQGTQQKGMCKDQLSRKSVQNLFAIASKCTGLDMTELLLEDPGDGIGNTVFAQPAVALADLVALTCLREDHPEEFSRIRGTSGHSLGLYVSLTLAGAISIESCFKIVSARGRAMEKAANGSKGAMFLVVGLEDSKLEEYHTSVRSLNKEWFIHTANFNFPLGRVVSGHADAVDVEIKLIQEKDKKLMVKRLLVSGAFHSPLMKPAQAELKDVLDSVEVRMPNISVWSNVLARPFSSVQEIRETLVRQVVENVLWEKSMNDMLSQGYTAFKELGPQNQLSSMARKILKGIKITGINVAPARRAAVRPAMRGARARR